MTDQPTHLPPQSIEAEEAVLGCMIENEGALTHALHELEPDDFYRPSHRTLFTTMGAMRSSGEPVDQLTLVTWLKERKTLENVGGAAAVMGLGERAWIANHKAYARTVRNYALLRSMVTTGHGLAELAYDKIDTTQRSDEHDPIRSAVDQATATLVQLRERIEGRSFAKRADIADLVGEWGEQYRREQSDPESGDAIPFPEHLPTLNGWTLGQRRGRVIVSSGFTGMGKSWFGLDCSETVLQHGGRVAYFSLELAADEIVERLVAMGGISYAQIQTRDAQWERMKDRIEQLSAHRGNFTILDGTCPPERIESEIVAARVAGKPYRYVVIDTVNLVDLPGRASEERQQLNRLLRRLKNMTLDHGITTHVQAQLKRVDHRNADEPPKMTDLRETSAMEQTADLILFVHRLPGIKEDTLSDDGCVVVAKGRNVRRRGRIDVTFDATGLRFMERPAFVAGMGTGRRSVA